MVSDWESIVIRMDVDWYLIWSQLVSDWMLIDIGWDINFNSIRSQLVFDLELLKWINSQLSN